MVARAACRIFHESPTRMRSRTSGRIKVLIVRGEECWAQVFTARLGQLSIGSMSYMVCSPVLVLCYTPDSTL